MTTAEPTHPSRSYLAALLSASGLILAALLLARLPVLWAAGLLVLAGFGFLTLLHPVIGLYTLTLAIPLTPQLRLPLGAGGLSLTDLLIAGVFLAWWMQLAARQERPRPAPLLWLVLPVALALLFSSLAATSLEEAIPELIKWAEVVVVYFLGAQLLTPRHRLPLAVTLLAAASLESIVGLRQFFFRLGPDAYLLGGFLRAYGTFGQPNPYAGYLGLVLPLALALTLWAAAAGWRRRRPFFYLRFVFFAGATILIGAGLVASWSRGAWLGAAVAGLTVLALASTGGRLAIAAGAAALLLLWPLLPAAFSGRLAEIGAYFGVWNARGVPVTDANFSVLERVAHWQVAWGMFADHPWLGVGVGNWAVIYPGYAFAPWTDPLGHAHNVIFHFAAEAGIIGILTFLGFWLGSLAAALRSHRRSCGPDRAIAAGVFGLLVHLSIHNLFDNLFVQGMPLVVALALALLPLEGRHVDR
jgi:O-antigen ligase